ncbi:filamentous hemagglutinin N-terminal domain-containing protein [Rhizorhabdus histidinilytica]
MRSSVSDIFAAERRRQRSMPRTMSSMAVLATVLAMPVKESLAANSYGFLGVPDGCLTATCSGTGYTIDRTFATSVDTVTVNAPSALITWVPNDTNGGTASVADAINFLPSGNTVNYVAGSGLANGEYTILNRIVPQPNADGRSIALNGTITTDTAKGNVWFYSPNGIVVGSTASFDVGGLLLTTSNITAGNVTLDGDGYVTAVDTQTSIAGAAVTIQSAPTSRPAIISASSRRRSTRAASSNRRAASPISRRSRRSFRSTTRAACSTSRSGSAPTCWAESPIAAPAEA